MLRGATALAAVWGIMGAGVAHAEDGDGDTITVTATRSPLDTFDAPAPVTVITEEQIEAMLATDIRDLVRFEPGVTVRNEPSRFGAALAATGRGGNTGFNIRGLEGNRVLFQVDGIRVPDSFSFGPNAFGRGDYIDLELLRSVEILRGPASALYGSDGLAGVVSFITRDPNDFIAPGETFALRARVSYASADESWAESFVTAGRWGDLSALLVYSRRDGHETENQGANFALNSTRTAPNPQETESNAMMGRLVWAPNAAHTFRFAGEYSERETVTEGYTGRAAPPLAATSVIDLDGIDQGDRSRYSLDWRYENEGGVIDRAFAAIYYQESWLRQFSDEDRNTAADRTRDTNYDNSVWGASLQLDSVFHSGGVRHRLIYGGDYAISTQGAIRGGTVPTPPAVFPERPFPETEYTRAGVFMVDEISLLGGSLTLFPGVRYDYYDLTPIDDALYTGPLAEQSGDAVTPRFGVVAWPTANFGVFFNYAEGFKAPSPMEVNNFFENLTLAGFGQAYTSISNPDLNPETSTSFEAGVRFRDAPFLGATWRAQGTLFTAWYEDFISQQIVGGNGTALTPFIYQYVNLNELDVWGLEGRIDGVWENGVGFTLSASWAEGDFTSAGVTAPYDPIDPFRVVGGLTFDGARFGGALMVTYNARKDASSTTLTAFRPESATIIDLTGYWHITEAATLRVGVFNATDETYWYWSDVRGLTTASTVRDSYTQPGRNFSASLSYRF